jgi:uncharacterized delta-60 repeat protein
MNILAVRRFAVFALSHAAAPAALTALTVLAASAGCGQILGVEAGILVNDAGGAPPSGADFALLVGPQTRITLVRNTAAALTVSIVRTGGSVGAVTVTTTGAPTGVSVEALTIAATATSGTLTLSASAIAALTVTGTLTITGTAGGITHEVTLPLVVRDPPGTLDITFGAEGIATIPISGASDGTIGPQGLAVQPDGRIVFCGNANYGTGGTIVLGRLTANGSSDGSFGSQHNGLVVTSGPEHSEDICFAVRLLPSGGMALGGFMLGSGEAHGLLLAQFTSSGLPDPSVGGGSGFAAIQINGADGGALDSKANDLAVQADGKLVLGGYAGATSTSSESAALLRLMPDGGVDREFGPNGDGIALFAAPGEITSIAVLPDDSILAPIFSTSFLAARVDPAGAIDPTYGDAGFAAAAEFPPLTKGIAEIPGAVSVALQSDGKTILVGTAALVQGGAGGGIALARFDSQGHLDMSFGQGGLVSTVLGGSAKADAIAITQDGGFAVAALLLTDAPIAVVRYEANGALDMSFAAVGYAGIPGVTGTVTGEAVAVDPAGRIVLGAFVGNGGSNSEEVVIARFWP